MYGYGNAKTAIPDRYGSPSRRGNGLQPKSGEIVHGRAVGNRVPKNEKASSCPRWPSQSFPPNVQCSSSKSFQS